MAYSFGARFCPGCGVRLDEPPREVRLSAAGERVFAWSRAEPATLGAGDGLLQIDTSADGVRRFAAWRNYLIGVVDTTGGPLIVRVRFVRRATVPAPRAGSSPTGGAEAPTETRVEEVPEVRLHWLDPAARRGGRRISAAQVEPVIIQGLALLPVGRALVAVDLFADELAPKQVLRLEQGELLASTIYQHGDELLTIIRSASGPRIILIRPPMDEKGVIKLGGEPWTFREAASEVADGAMDRFASSGAAASSNSFDAAPAQGTAKGPEAVQLGRRAILVGNSLYVPSKDCVYVASLTPYAAGPSTDGEDGPLGGGARWVWRRLDRPLAQRDFADGRYAWALGGDDVAGAVGTLAGAALDADEFDFGYESGHADLGWPGDGAALGGPSLAVSAGILLKGLDAEDEAVWWLLRPEPNGRLTLSLYPESEVIVAVGRIYGVSRKSQLTVVQEFDSIGGPKPRKVYVTGVALDRLLPVGDDLAALVKDGQALKFWVYDGIGSLRGSHGGGQELLGQGESICPPIRAEGRIVCIWTDARQIFVASARQEHSG